MSDLQPNPPSTTPPDATPQVATPNTPTKHPQPEMREVALDALPKKREPLNPAYAILLAAILSAGTAITATYLNIRSSERLQRERDRTDAAKKESDDLKAQLTALQTKLNETSNAVDALAETPNTTIVTTPVSPETTVGTSTVSVPATAAPLPSIIVVMPSSPPTVLSIAPTAKPEPTKVDPKPDARVVEVPSTPVSTQASTTTTTSTTILSSPTTVAATVPGPVPAAAALPSTVSTTKAP